MVDYTDYNYGTYGEYDYGYEEEVVCDPLVEDCESEVEPVVPIEEEETDLVMPDRYW